MASSLSPIAAAEAAKAVYDIRLSSDVEGAFASSTNLIREFSQTQPSSRFAGVSGGVFNSESGFGIVAEGSGTRAGELLIVTRGTKSASDWYNNAMCTLTLSSMPVHSGFNQIFQSFKDDLDGRVRNKSIKRVHCIGHSLGGALANLVADWMLNQRYAKEAELYTFGAPRVGIRRFSEHLTTGVTPNRIHRVYHHSDVVPMLPVWPFWHSPQPGDVCYVRAAGESDRPGGEYHDMGLYVESMKRFSKWSEVQKKVPPTHMDKQVKAWLASDSLLSFTTNTFSLINFSIQYVIKMAVAEGVQFVVGVGVHVFDALASFLVKVAALGVKFMELVGSLMRRILQALGVAVVATANITYQFVKWVFDKLSAALGRVADMAIRLTHRDL